MDKQTLSHYGWIVIVVLVLAVMLALATPFGTYVGDAVVNTAKGFVGTAENNLNEDNIQVQGQVWDNKFENGLGGNSGETDTPSEPTNPSEPETTYMLTVRVISEDGDIVSNATVTIKSENTEYTKTTDNNGIVSFDNLSSGTYEITVTAKNSDSISSHTINITNKNETVSVVVKTENETTELYPVFNKKYLYQDTDGKVKYAQFSENNTVSSDFTTSSNVVYNAKNGTIHISSTNQTWQISEDKNTIQTGDGKKLYLEDTVEQFSMGTFGYGKNYIVKKGMTFEEWVNSEFNVDGWIINNEIYIVNNNFGMSLESYRTYDVIESTSYYCAKF